MKSRRLRIKTTSPLHHGGGTAILGLVDLGVLRRTNGMPYLAGSAIKGRLRHAAGQIWEAQGTPTCAGRKRPCPPDAPCPACRIFGSPRRPGSLFFSDALPVAPFEPILRVLQDPSLDRALPADSSVRAGVGLGRATRTAQPQALFSLETLAEGLKFESKVEGDLDEEDELALRRAAALVGILGGGGAKGLSRCKLSWADEERGE